MTTFPSLALAGALAFTFAARAQTPAAPGSPDHAAHHPPGAASAAVLPTDRMATMDAHMKAMHEMHQKMARARTPEERHALMAEHMKLMQEGMSMMGGMGMGMGGMRGMGPMGAASAPMDMSTRQQMMEKRMDMMQSMMQMMIDRLQAQPPAAK